MNAERTELILLLILAAAVVLFGGSLLLAVINLGSQIASFGFLLCVQLALGALMLAFAAAVLGRLVAWVAGGFADLYERHRELAAELAKRAPWFLVLTTLGAQVVLAVADKSFQGKELITVAVSLILIVLFYLANDLITRKQRWLRWIGFLVWLLTVLALPFFVLFDRKFDWETLYRQALAVPYVYQAFYTLVLMVFVLAPLLFIRKRS
jgi:hypothetical protein